MSFGCAMGFSNPNPDMKMVSPSSNGGMVALLGLGPPSSPGCGRRESLPNCSCCHGCAGGSGCQALADGSHSEDESARVKPCYCSYPCTRTRLHLLRTYEVVGGSIPSGSGVLYLAAQPLSSHDFLCPTTTATTTREPVTLFMNVESANEDLPSPLRVFYSPVVWFPRSCAARERP